MVFDSVNPKVVTATAIAFSIGILLATVSLINLTRIRRLGFDFPPSASIAENTEGLQVLLINTPPHSPWAHSHFISAEIDCTSNRIRLCRYYLFWSPFSDHVLVGPTIAISDLPQNMKFEVEYWNGERFLPIGELTTGSGRKEMRWSQGSFGEHVASEDPK